MLVLLAVAGAAAVLGSAEASVAELTCGAVVLEDTTLGHDLVDCPGPALVIGAPNIRLDLHGHLVDGVGAGTGIDNSGGHDGVRIENGSVRQFENGVALSGARGNRVRRLRIGETTEGILLTAADANVIERNVVTGSSFDAIALIGAHDNDVRLNVASLSGDGVFVDGSNDNRIELNDLSDNGFGIDVQFAVGSRIAENVVRGNVIGIGLGASTDSEVELNLALENELFGIDLFAGSADNVVARNVARENGDGIFTSPSTLRTHLLGNRADANLDDGIDVNNPATTLTRNSASDNGDFGIEAVPGAADGGGNRAAGNGNAAQCLNLACG